MLKTRWKLAAKHSRGWLPVSIEWNISLHKDHQLVVTLFLVFFTTQTSKQSWQLQELWVPSCFLSVCALLMRRRWQGDTSAVITAGKALIVSPASDYSVWEPETEEQWWRMRLSPWAPCEPEPSCREPWCCSRQSSEPRHSLWQPLCTASLTGNTAPW